MTSKCKMHQYWFIVIIMWFLHGTELHLGASELQSLLHLASMLNKSCWLNRFQARLHLQTTLRKCSLNDLWPQAKEKGSSTKMRKAFSWHFTTLWHHVILWFKFQVFQHVDLRHRRQAHFYCKTCSLGGWNFLALSEPKQSKMRKQCKTIA